MLSQQELSDRFEIQDLVFHYAHLIDSKRFDALREDVFTADAHIDYGAMGGSVGDLEETITFLKASVTNELFPSTQHLNANVQVQLQGDEATGRVMCFNPMQTKDSQVFFLGMWYQDTYLKVNDQWFISSRIEESSWSHNVPSSVNTELQ